MKTPVFTGSCTATITPFNSDGIDFETLEKLIEFQISSGTSAIVLAGTTGENCTLEIHEFEKLVDFSLRKIRGRLKVIAGIGGNNTKLCLEKATIAQEFGADALLLTAPYYNKTSQRGLIEHFTHVADNTNIPLILYNVPSRTSIGIPHEVYRELSKHPNINGVKEASGSFSLIMHIVESCGDDLNIWSGNDDNAIAMMSIGAKGVISVLSNIFPQQTAEICDLCFRGKYAEALSLYKNYSVLVHLLFCETNPIPVKAAMKILGMDSGMLRLPLVDISRENYDKLETELKRLCTGIPI